MSASLSTSSPLHTADPRLRRLFEWTREQLGSDDVELAVASADASFRRYFRVRMPGDAARTWIVMDAPPDKEDVAPYVRVAEMLANAGVNAPRVLAENRTEGFLLLTDLGNRTYLAELQDDPSRAETLYGDALTTLVRMQAGCAAAAPSLPPYEAALLKRELELFPDWFLTQELKLTITTTERELLDRVFARLIDVALAQPRVFVHRDYHSRNLMVAGGVYGPNPGVLDFQDAVCGPMTYDLVSLLRDCYIAWPLERVHAWVRDYRVLAERSGLDVGASETQFLRWFDLMGVQRQLKAIGIFARLWHRDGKRGYLSDIPRTLRYVRSVLPDYAEFAEFAHFIEARIAPAVGAA